MLSSSLYFVVLFCFRCFLEQTYFKLFNQWDISQRYLHRLSIISYLILKRGTISSMYVNYCKPLKHFYIPCIGIPTCIHIIHVNLYFKYSDRNLFVTIMDLFIAGSETVATTLRWGMLYFLHYPDIQEKCRQDILQVSKQYFSL